MTKPEFAAELGGIQRLLREHAFLAYAPSGRAEYDRKLATCAEYFAYLVYRKTGIPVSVLPELVPMETLRDPTFAAGRALAERVGKLARARSELLTGPERQRWERCAAAWERASAKLTEPDSR